MKPKQQTRHIFLYDLKTGLLARFNCFLPIVFAALFACMSLAREFTFNGGRFPVFIEYVFQMFAGEVDLRTLTEIRRFPYLWFFILIYLIIIQSGFLRNDLQSFGKNIVIRLRTRRQWFFSKCVWVSVTVVVYFTLIFLAIAFFAAIMGGFDERFHIVFSAKNNRAPILPFSGFDMVWKLFVYACVSGIALSLFRLALEILFPPAVSFVVLIAYLAASYAIYSPWLVGNATMLLRNGEIVANGLNMQKTMLASALMIVFSIVIGWMAFKRYDILERDS